MSILWLDSYVVNPPQNHVKAPVYRRIDWTVAAAWVGAAFISYCVFAGLYQLGKFAAVALVRGM